MPATPAIFWLYIARCKDRSFYTGIAVDVARRIELHNAGRGAKYTATRRPVKLVYTELCGSRSAALKREHRVKHMSHAAKEALSRSAGIRWGKKRPGRRSVG